ncbi:MAG: hypothetical protein FWE28_01005 [Oscillospiraceae bacterium]|nr:hypothetical protein [Oscillospiraceae bacterium]
MEYLANCSIIMDIDCIDSITGGYGYDCGYKYSNDGGGGRTEFEMLITTRNKEEGNDRRYKLIFGNVWDMRYSGEFTNNDRFFKYRKNSPKELIDNGIYIVENSEYIKFVEAQDRSMELSGFKHYVLYDKTDSVFDILASEGPQLVEIE